VRHDILTGWKEIANYLGMVVRTLQRYEVAGLPIHRPSGGSKGSVVAVRSELDAWITKGHIQVDSMPRSWPSNRTNRLGAEFLQTDSEVALTFSGLALEAKSVEKRQRTTRVARRAYDTIMRLKDGIDLSPAELHKLNGNLQRLKRELEKLGEKF